MLSKLVYILVFLINLSVASEGETRAAGIFLYMDCPNDPKERCALLINKSVSDNRGFFSNPSGVLDADESPEQGAVRVVRRELGHFFRFDVSDLGRDFQSPANTGLIQFDNYSLFFKQIQSTSADKIALAIKNYFITLNVDENSEVAIVPLKDILDNLKNGAPIQVKSNNRRMYANLSGKPLPDTLEIQLDPLMVELLKKDMDSNPQVNWLTWMKSTPRVSDIKAKQAVVKELKTVENQSQREMQAIHEGLGVKYVPHGDTLVLREHAARNPANLPYTASEAHIFLMMKDLIKSNPEKYQSDYMETTSMEKMVDDFLDDFSLEGSQYRNKQEWYSKIITPELKVAVHKILRTERDHKNMYVAYHAMKEEYSVLMDLISAIRSKLMGRQVQNLGGVWDTNLQNMNFNTLAQFLELRMDESKKVKDRYPRTVDQRRFAFQYLKLGGNVLSANLALFGNNNASLEYTFLYWLGNQSLNGSGALFESVLRSLGIDGVNANQRLQELKGDLAAEGIKETGGRLLQIFIDPDMIDKVAYVSLGSRPFEMEVRDHLVESEYQPSKMIYRIRENPEAVNNELLKLPYSLEKSDNQPSVNPRTRPEINWLQLRILPLPTQTTKDYNVKVVSYRNKPLTLDQEKIYWDKINGLADELLLPALRGGLRGFGPHGRTHPPKLMRQLKEEHPDQIKDMASESVIRGWIDADNSKKLLAYLKERPDDINIGVDDHSNVISYIIKENKWQLLQDVLANAIPVPLSISSVTPIIYNIVGKIDDNRLNDIIFQGLCRFPLDGEFWPYLVSYIGYNYFDVNNVDKQGVGQKIIQQIIEKKPEFREAIFQKLIGGKSLPSLVFLLTNYPGDVDGKHILDAFITGISESIYIPNGSNKEIMQINLFIDSLETYLKNYSCDDIEYTGDAKLAVKHPSSIKKLKGFLGALDKNRYPNFHRVLEQKLKRFL